MKAIGYVRVSTREQREEGISPEVQVASIQRYAALAGLELLDTVSDLGVSAGKPLARRRGGQRVLAAVEEGEVEAVVAIRLDRLFRNAVDCLQVVEGWDKADVGLHLVNQGGSSIDTRSATGRFLLTIMAGVAEMERAITRERVLDALEHKQERDERTGTVPYGYRVWEGDGKRLVEDDAEQAVIRYVFERRAAGASYRALAAEMNERGIPCRGEQWSHTTLHRLVKRESGDDWRPRLRGGSDRSTE